MLSGQPQSEQLTFIALTAEKHVPHDAGGADERISQCLVHWWLHNSDAAIQIGELEHALPQAFNHIRDANFKRQNEYGILQPTKVLGAN